jgi:hypothetical protein
MKKIRVNQLKIKTTNDLYDVKSPKESKSGNEEPNGNLSTKTDKRFKNVLSPSKGVVKFNNGSTSTSISNIAMIFSKKITNLGQVSDLKSQVCNEYDFKEKNLTKFEKEKITNTDISEKSKLDSCILYY